MNIPRPAEDNMVQCRAIARPLTLTILEIMFAPVSSMRTKLTD